MDECSICLGTLVNPVNTVCNHTYCYHCLISWLEYNNTCPICRYRLITDLENQRIVLVSPYFIKYKCWFMLLWLVLFIILKIENGV